MGEPRFNEAGRQREIRRLRIELAVQIEQLGDSRYVFDRGFPGGDFHGMAMGRVDPGKKVGLPAAHGVPNPRVGGAAERSHGACMLPVVQRASCLQSQGCRNVQDAMHVAPLDDKDVHVVGGQIIHFHEVVGLVG